MRNRIIDAMRRKGIYSMADLERKAGIPAGTMRNLGQGHMPSMDKINKIASYLDVTVDWIVNGDGTNAPEDNLIENKKITEPKQSNDPVKEFARLISCLNEQNMEALTDYLKYLVEKQGRC